MDRSEFLRRTGEGNQKQSPPYDQNQRKKYVPDIMSGSFDKVPVSEREALFKLLNWVDGSAERMQSTAFVSLARLNADLAVQHYSHSINVQQRFPHISPDYEIPCLDVVNNCLKKAKEATGQIKDPEEKCIVLLTIAKAEIVIRKLADAKTTLDQVAGLLSEIQEDSNSGIFVNIGVALEEITTQMLSVREQQSSGADAINNLDYYWIPVTSDEALARLLLRIDTKARSMNYLGVATRLAIENANLAVKISKEAYKAEEGFGKDSEHALVLTAAVKSYLNEAIVATEQIVNEEDKLIALLTIVKVELALSIRDETSLSYGFGVVYKAYTNLLTKNLVSLVSGHVSVTEADRLRNDFSDFNTAFWDTKRLLDENRNQK